MDRLHEKQRKLEEYLSGLGSVAVSFSSGVDSTFLLACAKKVLGDNVIAVTAAPCMVPKREVTEATQFCRHEGIRHIIIGEEELPIDGFAHNPPNRCYLCKREIFTKILGVAKENGMANVVEGSNADDTGDYRPGMKAIEELGIKSPLREADLTKEDIRALSKEAGLPTWNKPSFACLASRFVYGEEISPEKLEMVDKAEQLLLDLGFTQVRVRVHGNIARLEVLPSQFEKLIEEGVREKIHKAFKDIGFDYVTADLAGYRTGSMNETLKDTTPRQHE